MHRWHREEDGTWNRRTGAGVVSPLDAIITLAAGRPIFNADYYVVDGVSGEVRSWVDYSDPTHVLDQSLSARQVALPSTSADFGGALGADFFDNGLYISNRPASAWRFCHDGTGVSWYFVGTPLEAPNTASRFIWGTLTGGGTTFALLLGGNGASTWRHEISNGAVVYNPSAAITLNTPTYVSCHFATARNPDALYQQRSATVSDADLSGVPDAGNPSSTMVMGANIGFGSLGRFRFRSLMFFPLLSPAERAIVEAYILTDTGLTP